MGGGMRKKRLYDFRGFSGIDASNEISLFEYGLLWQCRNKEIQEFLFVYGVSVDNDSYDKFAYGWLTLKDWQALCLEEWFELSEVCQFCGGTENEFVTNFPHNVFTAIQYHGAENILGTDYSGGFTISGGY
jgi:hypothetical protein